MTFQTLHPRLTPSRAKWLTLLLKGPADPAANRLGRTQSDCLNLGWTERGAMIGDEHCPFKYPEIEARFGERYWDRPDFKGYWDSITDDGRAALTKGPIQ
ncbi:hypothetical protein [Hyphococcus sp.]|uniref:hypothetical protein n=1 Tax=Hyphococcus sp. TaxID=2038636 RepID=UPI002089D101|nr:MAG: hypothetical protein DHS20C04_27280 [Marinicaulis sp.]